MFAEVFGVDYTLTSARLHAQGFEETRVNGNSTIVDHSINGDIVAPSGHDFAGYVEGDIERMCCGS